MMQVEVSTRGWEGMNRRLAVGLRDAEAWIKNIVPYVVYLEFGTSAQAPQGMARVSIPEIHQELTNQMSQITYGQLAAGGSLQEAINNAVDNAASYGRTLIRGRTPIRTGWARLGWVVVTSAGEEIAGPPLGTRELRTIAGRGETGRAFF